MEERHTHKTPRDITHTLISLANADADEAVKVVLIEARQETAMIVVDESRGRIANPSNDASVRRILAIVARHVLDQAIMGASNIVYCNQSSALGFHKENGSLSPIRFNTMSGLLPIPGLDLDEESESDIQISLRMFGFLIENGTLSPEKVGKCPICTRYFVSRRSGQRRSRACGRSHQAILAAREHRQSSRYKADVKKKNTERMRLVRTAEKLIVEWIDQEVERPDRYQRLVAWNQQNAVQLSDKVIRRIAGMDS